MASYYKYTIQALTPIRIADNASSQSGQTDTLTFIPGSTIRGLFISSLASAQKLDSYKKALFTDQVCFLNAYLTTGEHTLIPSPKGFYEDKKISKGEKKVENVVIAGKFTEGHKRASLGRYCYIAASKNEASNDCIYYYSVDTGSDLKINIKNQQEFETDKANVSEETAAKDNSTEPAKSEKQSLFRSEYMSAEQYFQGYIRLSDNESLNQEIKQLLAEDKIIYLGNGRSAGLGKVRIFNTETIDSIPYQADIQSESNECYMMLLSDTVMRDEEGEYTGLNLTELETKLGVTNLKVSYASTSVRNVKGYNSKLGAPLPSVVMYSAGSVFHLSYTGTISKEAMKKVCDEGIGVRKNEGFGRVMFPVAYEKISCKKSVTYAYHSNNVTNDKITLTAEDLECLKIAAKGYFHRNLDEAMKLYVISYRLKTGGVSDSQLGTFRSILTKFRYEPDQAKENLKAFFDHAKDKSSKQKIHKDRATYTGLEKEFYRIMETPLITTLATSETPIAKDNTVMGVPIRDFFSEEEENLYKLKLLIELIRFNGKGK